MYSTCELTSRADCVLPAAKRQRREPTWLDQLSECAADAREQLCSAVQSRVDAVLTAHEDTEMTLQVLSIGSGDGTLEAELVRRTKFRRTVHVTIIEPSTERATEAEDALRAAGVHSLTTLRTTFERALPTLLSKPYDIVLLSHSLYFLGECDATRLLALAEARKLAAPGGLVMVILASVQGVGGLMTELYEEQAAAERVEETRRMRPRGAAGGAVPTHRTLLSRPFVAEELLSALERAPLADLSDDHEFAHFCKASPAGLVRWHIDLNLRGVRDDEATMRCALAFLLDMDAETFAAQPPGVIRNVATYFRDSIGVDGLLRDQTLLLEWTGAAPASTPPHPSPHPFARAASATL